MRVPIFQQLGLGDGWRYFARPHRIPAAHLWCQSRRGRSARRGLLRGGLPFIVSAVSGGTTARTGIGTGTGAGGGGKTGASRFAVCRWKNVVVWGEG